MMDLRNNTPFPAQLNVCSDREGEHLLVVNLKATIGLSQDAQHVQTEQVALLPGPIFRDMDEPSSLIHEGDLGLPCPGMDLGIVGEAYSPNQAAQVDVGIRVGDRVHVARVFGERRWQRGLMGLSISQPQPFSKQPLVFENAYGGWDTSPDDPKHAAYEPRNPVGRGFHAKKGKGPKDGDLLPSIQQVNQVIRDWHQSIDPVGFGFTPTHWHPRANYAGTYDETWRSERCPLLPEDFDDRFYHAAVPQLTFDEPIDGSTIELWNLFPFEYLQVPVPKYCIRVEAQIGNQLTSASAKLDRLTLLPGDGLLTLLFKATFACTRKMHQVKFVRTELDP
ncbi:MAG: DUF2169 domain-containing protein [Acidobacteria bacterium]|nr:DUF2169 domain-containing protein [Acidobacteriota bacterium]